MIKVLALFGPKPHWSQGEFIAHYLERHAPLCAGTTSFTGNCARYVQNVRLDTSAGEDDRLEHVAISEMWFDDAARLSATYSAEDYIARLRPDEQSFANFDTARVWLCREQEILPITASRASDPDKFWASAPRVQLFLFRHQPTDHDHHLSGARWIKACGKTILDIGRASGLRRYCVNDLLPEAPADLPRPANDRTAVIEQFSFASIENAHRFCRMLDESTLIQARGQELTDGSELHLFLAQSHTVFE